MESTIGHAADVKIARSASIKGEHVSIGPGSAIGENVTIDAKEVRIGHKVVIQSNCDFRAVCGSADLISIGDFSFIGYDTTVAAPVFVVGDYATIHNHFLVTGYKPCRIGHNSYIGRHSLLNSSEELTIGNNFRMALNGYVWTHAAAGELLEGCRFYHCTPTVIEDNVWLAGCNISISPGVRLGNGSIILMGSVVTKDTLPRHCYGGVPARDLTDQLKPYRNVSLKEKAFMMRGFVREFIESYGKYRDAFDFILRPGVKVRNPAARIVIVERGAPEPIGDGVSVFSLSDKTYLKQRTEIEEAFMRFMVKARARFVPVE